MQPTWLFFKLKAMSKIVHNHHLFYQLLQWISIPDFKKGGGWGGVQTTELYLIFPTSVQIEHLEYATSLLQMIIWFYCTILQQSFKILKKKSI